MKAHLKLIAIDQPFTLQWAANEYQPYG